MAHVSAQQNPRWKDLKPYVSPPAEARVRGVLMRSADIRVQVIVPELEIGDLKFSGLEKETTLATRAYPVNGTRSPTAEIFVAPWVRSQAEDESVRSVVERIDMRSQHNLTGVREGS